MPPHYSQALAHVQERGTPPGGGVVGGEVAARQAGGLPHCPQPLQIDGEQAGAPLLPEELVKGDEAGVSLQGGRGERRSMGTTGKVWGKGGK